jgi:phosphatidylinositol alpha 1,6-mannosyltransferase
VIETILTTEAVHGASKRPDSPIQRVAVLTEAFLPKVDGVSRTALLTIKYLQATGRNLLIAAPTPTIPKVGDTPVTAIPSLPLPSYPETRVAPLWLPLIDQIRRFKPDLIHLFSPFGLGSAGMVAGSLLKVPVIANYQTDLPAYATSYGHPYLRDHLIGALRFIHNGCTLTLAPSPVTIQELREWGFHRLRLWERGIDTVRFAPNRREITWREKLLNGRDAHRLIALYVGRLARDKHIETLKQLAALPGVALTLVGDGSYRPELQGHFGATDAYFMGPLHGDDLARAYASADVFVFPGPEETFGQVVLEAMASGLPVIVTDRGGPQTLVTEKGNGFIVPVDDGAAFADRVRQLRDHPLMRSEMRHAARTYAEGRPWIKLMEQLEGYYEDAHRLYQRHHRGITR